MADKCVVCRARPRDGILMCRQCGRSWDKDAARDSTMDAAVRWTAARAWRFARKRAAKEKGK